MSQKARAMLNLFKDCKLKHKKGCFAGSCEECIDRFDNNTLYKKIHEESRENY